MLIGHNIIKRWHNAAAKLYISNQFLRQIIIFHLPINSNLHSEQSNSKLAFYKKAQNTYKMEMDAKEKSR